MKIFHFLYRVGGDTLFFQNYTLVENKAEKYHSKVVVEKPKTNAELKIFQKGLAGKWRPISNENKENDTFTIPYNIDLLSNNTFTLSTACPTDEFLDYEDYQICEYTGTWTIDENNNLILKDNLNNPLGSIQPIFTSINTLFLVTHFYNENGAFQHSYIMQKEL